LLGGIRKVLERAIEAQAVPARMPKSFLLRRRQRGARRPRCGAPIKTTTIGGRAAYHCPKCQR